MTSKTELMQAVEAGLSTEVFSHTECGDFDVTAMRKYAQVYVKPVRANIADVLDFIRANRDYDEGRVDSLKLGEYMHDPAMAIQYEDGSTLLIDGTHRILRRHKEGLTYFPLYVLTEKDIIRPDTIGKVEREWGKFNIRNGKVVPR